MLSEYRRGDDGLAAPLELNFDVDGAELGTLDEEAPRQVDNQEEEDEQEQIFDADAVEHEQNQYSSTNVSNNEEDKVGELNDEPLWTAPVRSSPSPSPPPPPALPPRSFGVAAPPPLSRAKYKRHYAPQPETSMNNFQIGILVMVFCILLASLFSAISLTYIMIFAVKIDNDVEESISTTNEILQQFKQSGILQAVASFAQLSNEHGLDWTRAMNTTLFYGKETAREVEDFLVNKRGVQKLNTIMDDVAVTAALSRDWMKNPVISLKGSEGGS